MKISDMPKRLGSQTLAEKELEIVSSYGFPYF